MEIKEWTYEEYPAFEEEVEGAVRIPTTGDEPGTYIYEQPNGLLVDGMGRRP